MALSTDNLNCIVTLLLCCLCMLYSPRYRAHTISTCGVEKPYGYALQMFHLGCADPCSFCLRPFSKLYTVHLILSGCGSGRRLVLLLPAETLECQQSLCSSSMLLNTNATLGLIYMDWCGPSPCKSSVHSQGFTAPKGTSETVNLLLARGERR